MAELEFGTALAEAASQAEERPERTRRRLRRRPFAVDKKEATTHVLEVVRHAQDERTSWLDFKTARYAKLRGWIASRDWPWEHASNQHIPIMMGNSLRSKAGLFNAVLGIRPVMEAKTLQRRQKDAADRAAGLIDYQIFMESEGEERISNFIDQFVDDGTVFSHCRWVRDKRTVTDVRILPKPLGDLRDEIPPLLQEAVFLDKPIQEVIALDDEGFEWRFVFAPIDPIKDNPLEVRASVYDKSDDELDNRIEVVLSWEAVTYDGPTFVVQELEDIVAPLRSTNLQPVTPQNPTGAPWVARISKINLDQLRRGKRDGTYNLLTDEDLEKIESVARERVPQAPGAHEEDQSKEQKEITVGLDRWPSSRERDWVTAIEWYGSWQIKGDSRLKEEVIFTVIREAEVLVRAKTLTEIYPGLPPRRPFAEARFIPVPGQLYGIGLLELMEGLHDFIHILFNQTVDAGTIANVPPFFYRASSGFKPDILRYYPGEGIPLDNPQTDIVFPNIPGRDQQWGLNMVALAIQMMDKLVQIGPIQLGQVPTGKASALRTVGTTMALLQQGAALPEQVLRRLFSGLSQIWSLFHALNTRYLPREKEFLLAGKPTGAEDAYGVIDNPDDLAVPIIFDFQATLLNTNKGLVAQSLLTIGQALLSPFFLQMGLVGPEQAYNWAKDLVKAAQLDDSKYLLQPQGMPEGPRILAEEALSLILNGQEPTGAPLEPTVQHFQKLQTFANSPDFAMLDEPRRILFQRWVATVQAILQAEAQQQQLVQAAAQFSQHLGQGGGTGQGGSLTSVQEPPMQTESPEQSEIAGAMGGGG